MDETHIPETWHQLDPVFIRGMQRSGTSILNCVLSDAGIIGFAEGHLCADLIETLSRLYDPTYKRGQVMKQAYFALGEGRHVLFEKYIALAIDRYHRDLLCLDSRRWFDKSPGCRSVEALPMLIQLFPRSQIIFVYRNGISTVHSGISIWPTKPEIFKEMCQNWTRTMSTWRKLKPLLQGRYIELAQENMVQEPDQVALILAGFLHTPHHQTEMAECLRSCRANSSFPDRPPQDYAYQIDWSEQQKAFFIETCQTEMKAWGYPLDFQHPAASNRNQAAPHPSPIVDMPTYYAWLSESHLGRVKQERNQLRHLLQQSEANLGQVEQERDQLRRLLQRINQGRVMRAMNKITRGLQRLGLQQT